MRHGAQITVTPHLLGIGRDPHDRWIAFMRLDTNHGDNCGFVHMDVTEEVEGPDHDG